MESIIQDLNKFGEEEICTELTLQSFSSWAKKKKCKIVLPKVKPITFDCETILKPRSCFTPIQKKIYPGGREQTAVWDIYAHGEIRRATACHAKPWWSSIKVNTKYIDANPCFRACSLETAFSVIYTNQKQRQIIYF